MMWTGQGRLPRSKPIAIYRQPIVSQLGAPLYDAGARLPRVRARFPQTVRQPAYPLHEAGAWRLSGLGQEGPKVLQAAAPIAATATTAILAPVFATGVTAGGAAGAGAAAGSWAGPIGAGVGVLIGVLAGLWAAHSARVAGATHENQAINSAVNTWDAGMKAIFAAANSSDPTQNVTGAQAAQQVAQLWQQFWAMMSPLIGAPGTADTSMRGANCGSSTLNPAGACAGTPQGHKCDNSCTATCCVGCQDLYPSMLQALQVLNSPAGGTVQVCQVSGSGYGAQRRAGYTLTYTPPAISLSSGGAGASMVTDLTSGISRLFGSAGAGSPAGNSLLPILAIGALAYFVLR